MTTGGSARSNPSGTRDILPDEMRELRELTRAMIDELDQRGYGEVRTPALEYGRSMPGSNLGPEAAYRMLDEHGEDLSLRADMTLPIARVAATRCVDSPRPLRFCYLAHAWRKVKPRAGTSREVLQIGAELFSGQGRAAETEILETLAAVLTAAGLQEWRIGIGDAGIVPELLVAQNVGPGLTSELLGLLASQDLSGFERVAREAGGSLDRIVSVVRGRFPSERHSELLDDPTLGESAAGIASLLDSLPASVRERVIVDLSLSPRIDYYGGMVFEVYDPAVGRPLGGGGRYDRLLSALGTADAAVGFALDVELLHVALAGEERGERPAKEGE